MSANEKAVVFKCEDQELIGIVHGADAGTGTGVLIVVGGPQYRVGSHRQFLLLARHLAANGVPVMRFDYRGMGDSDGGALTFEGVDGDIRSAIDCFMGACPGLKSVVLWGLCDAASAISFYAASDSRVSGVVLLNPWVRTESGEAQAYVKSYYLSRLLSRDFWMKILKGGFNITASAKSLGSNISKALVRTEAGSSSHSLPERVLSGLSAFTGDILFVLSGNDLTAGEFKITVSNNREWDLVVQRDNVTWRDLKEANHTFSTRQWRDQVSEWTLDWLRSR